jgi:uncharacterized membrane protein YgcG
MSKIIKITTLLLLTGFCLMTPCLAEAKSWDFESWQVDIQINQDATFVVRETQTFNFRGNFHWVEREIPKQKLRKITDVKIFDEQGRQLTGKEIEIKETKSQVSIKLNFDLTDTQKTWTFQYKVHGGLGYFADYDELYWNAVSSERDVPIKEVEVLVHLPKSLVITGEDIIRDVYQNIQQKLYVGPLGSRQTSSNYQIVDEETLRYWGTNIGPNENFTIVAGWPKEIIRHGGIVKVDSSPDAEVVVDGKGTGLTTPAVLEEGYEISKGQHQISVKKFGWRVRDSSPFQTVEIGAGSIEEIKFRMEKTEWLQLLAILPLIIPLAALFLTIRKWIKIPRARKTIIAQYEPPDKLAPAEVGALVYSKVQPRDISAMLIDLACRGYLKIVEKEKKAFFGKKFTYSLVRQTKTDGDLRDYEKRLLVEIFDSKQIVELKELKKKKSLAGSLPEIKKKIFKKLVTGKYLTRISNQAGWVVLGMFLFIIGVFIQSAIRSLALGAAIAISGWVVIFGSRILSTTRTQKGAEARWYALGFKEYLQVAERFRLAACTPETFEKYLSYAMVFKVEKKWAARFVDICKKPPDWYETSRPIAVYSVLGFTRSVSAMSGSFVSSVVGGSASGASGFGGGGFAGGGGGGGGSGAG